MKTNLIRIGIALAAVSAGTLIGAIITKRKFEKFMKENSSSEQKVTKKVKKDEVKPSVHQEFDLNSLNVDKTSEEVIKEVLDKDKEDITTKTETSGEKETPKALLLLQKKVEEWEKSQPLLIKETPKAPAEKPKAKEKKVTEKKEETPEKKKEETPKKEAKPRGKKKESVEE